MTAITATVSGNTNPCSGKVRQKAAAVHLRAVNRAVAFSELEQQGDRRQVLE